jgi:hypothetical protein
MATTSKERTKKSRDNQERLGKKKLEIWLSNDAIKSLKRLMLITNQNMKTCSKKAMRRGEIIEKAIKLYEKQKDEDIKTPVIKHCNIEIGKGKGLSEIAEELNKQSLPALSGHDRWDEITLQTLLKEDDEETSKVTKIEG